MTTYQPGDVVLVAFPHTGKTRTKNRPALVILDTGDADVVVARVTTQLHQTPHDVDGLVSYNRRIASALRP
jgi:mRNA interferase MazF